MAIVVGLGVFSLAVRRYRANNAGGNTCELLCRAGCEKDKACGGFKGDCADACRTSCAKNPTRPVANLQQCLRHIESISCKQADVLGRGGDTEALLGPDCAAAPPPTPAFATPIK